MIQIEASSSQNQLAFLRMAAEDDRFRAELQTNPSEVLHRFGLRVPEAALASGVELPGKNEIDAALNAFTWSEVEEEGFEQKHWLGLLG